MGGVIKPVDRLFLAGQLACSTPLDTLSSLKALARVEMMRLGHDGKCFSFNTGHCYYMNKFCSIGYTAPWKPIVRDPLAFLQPLRPHVENGVETFIFDVRDQNHPFSNFFYAPTTMGEFIVPTVTNYMLTVSACEFN